MALQTLIQRLLAAPRPLTSASLGCVTPRRPRWDFSFIRWILLPPLFAVCIVFTGVSVLRVALIFGLNLKFFCLFVFIFTQNSVFHLTYLQICTSSDKINVIF